MNMINTRSLPDPGLNDAEEGEREREGGERERERDRGRKDHLHLAYILTEHNM